VREDIAKGIGDLHVELTSRRPVAVLNRPNFIKDPGREARFHVWERSGENVILNRKQMLRAQEDLRAQYRNVKNNLVVRSSVALRFF